MGGVFSEFASLHASNIVRYDGASWLPLEPGQGQIPAYPRLDPTALATGPDGVLYLGATNSYDLAVYSLDGGVLSQLGPTFYSTNTYDNLTALIADPYSGSLYVAGKFDSIGEVTVNNIARWDGQKWQPMQGGLDGRVYALAFDQAGNLYVGGEFYHAGSLAVDGLAIWGPLGWEKPPGTGLACSENCGIKALAWDPVNYRLYIGGVMATPSGWRQVLYWDPFFGYFGITGNPASSVKTLAVDKNGHLFVGFSSSYSAYLAEWDGNTWTTPGSIGQLVYSLASDALGNIYASGEFSQIGSLTVNYIARYDGSQWSAMGSGVSSAPYALAVDSANRLFVGGNFDGAGSRKVSGLARWSLPPAAQLFLNYTTGQPGSEIAVTGVNFIPNGQASIKVNGQLLDDSFLVAADGSLAFRLSTSLASQGRYLVTVQQNPTASASFTLQDSLPLRKPEAALPVFNIPAGLGLTHLSYLPLLRK